MRTKRRTKRSARQLFRLCVVNGVLDEQRVRTVVTAAIASKRRGVTTMLTEFERLVRLDLQRHSARVESAVTLADPIRAVVINGVTKSHGPNISTSFIENPELIGGMRITVGSDVYDGSVRGRLIAIASQL